jgi:hypothetical protein
MVVLTRSSLDQRSTGRGGMGNIKNTANQTSSPTVDNTTSVAGREAPSSTASAKAARTTGRGGAGNIARARSKNATQMLPATTASIVAEYEAAKARRERMLIERSTDARKRNVVRAGVHPYTSSRANSVLVRVPLAAGARATTTFSRRSRSPSPPSPPNPPAHLPPHARALHAPRRPSLAHSLLNSSRRTRRLPRM